MKFQVSAIALGCIALLSGCGGGGGGSSDGGKSQSITFNFPGGGLIGIPPNVTTTKLVAIASGGGPVTFTTETPTCTVSGDTLSLVKAGECIVTAHQAGGNGYAAASQSQLFVIPKNPQAVVKFQNPGWQPVGGAPVQLAATFDTGLPATFSSKTPTICSVSGNTVTPLANGMCTVTATQAGTDTYAALAVDKNIPIGTELPAKLDFLTGYKNQLNANEGFTTNEGLMGHPGNNMWWCMDCSESVSDTGDTFTHTATWSVAPQPSDWDYNAATFTVFGANIVDADLWDVSNSPLWYRGGVKAFTLPLATPKGVQIETQGALHFNLAENAEWFGTSDNSFSVELLLGHFDPSQTDGGGHACTVTLKATVKPTAAAATDYSVNLRNQFVFSETCGMSGLDVWNELLSYPVVGLRFSAVKSNSEVTDSSGKYVSQITLKAPVYFQ